MKKYTILTILLTLPFLFGFLTSRYSPWWGLREQASAPTAPTNGIKFWCDSSNNGYLLNESGSNYKLNVYDPNNGLPDPTSIGTLSLGSGSITDTSGAINLGNETLDTTGTITGGLLRAGSSVWYYCKYMDSFSVSRGASGATLTVPDSNTLGGYQLDAASEYLYFNGRACANWDGASDVTVHVFWECYVDNTGGNAADTVDLHLECYFKGNAETTVKTQTLEEVVTVGQSAQYKQFNTSFTIDYNDGTNPIDTDDIFSFRLNLETDTSEVDNIMVNFLVFRYQTKKVHIEI